MFDSSINHPFCDTSLKPDWSLLTPEQAETDIYWALRIAQERINSICKLPKRKRTFDNTFGALWWCDYELDLSLRRLGLLRSLTGNKDYTAVILKLGPAINNLHFTIVTNARLFSVLESVANKKGKPSTRRHVSATIKNFKERGLSLSLEKQARSQELSNALTKDVTAFNENVTKYIDSWKFFPNDIKDMEGVPQPCLELARKKAIESGSEAGSYLFDLRDENLYYVSNFARNKHIRHIFVQASAEVGKKNEDVVKRIVLNRAKKAELFGYKTFADMALEHNMLSTPAEVEEFVEKRREAIQEDFWKFLKECRAKAGNENTPLESSDISYYQEQIRKERYNYDIDATRKYFPLPSVLAGLFAILEEKLHLQFKQRRDTAGEHLWHSSVQVYEVFHKDKFIGDLYLDLYTRQGKTPGAWSSCLQSHYVNGNPICRNRKPYKAQHLVAANFKNDSDNTESNGLDHTELETLFHEMGHAVHSLLSTPEYPVQEASNVERDFIEVPSSLMEHLTWEKDVLHRLNALSVYKLPEDLADTIVSCKDRLSAWSDYRQVVYNKIDQVFNGMTVQDAEEFANSEQTLESYTHEFLFYLLAGVSELSNLELMPYHFQHIFGAGYAAQYYSYMHSEDIARKVYASLCNGGYKAWERWCACVLEKGASSPARAMIDEFLQVKK